MPPTLKQFIVSILVVVLCAACSSNSALPIATAGITAAPTATEPIPTADHTPKPASATPLPAPTRAAPTATIQPTSTATPPPIPGEWRAPVVNLSGWEPAAYARAEWEAGDHALSFSDRAGNAYLLDPDTGRLRATIVPTPTPEKGADTVAAAAGYQVECRAGGVRLVRLSDGETLSTAALPVDSCREPVQWSPDGMAAALATNEGELYLWLPDGSSPQMLGECSNWAMPLWSPDGTRILVWAPIKDSPYTPDIFTFNIAYRDGRPMLKPGVQIEIGNGWGGLQWETNDTITNQRWGGSYSIYDYYDARTGRFLFRNEEAGAGYRRASISPNGRWLARYGSPRDAKWDQRYEMAPEDTPYGLLACDLETLRQCPLLAARLPAQPGYRSDSDSIKFLGWNAISSRLYLIYFPVGTPAFDLPAGLLALFPQSGYIEPVLPDVAFGLASPDREHVFLVTAETIEENRAAGLSAAVYTLDGAPVAAPEPFADQIEYSTLNEWDFYAGRGNRLVPSEWSPDGRRLVYLEPDGEIWLADTAGDRRLLAAHLPPPTYEEPLVFTWSPDGQYLLVSFGYRSWVARIQP